MKQNVISLLIFITGTLIFRILEPMIQNSLGFFYYALASIIDLTIILILSKFSHLTRLIVQIQTFCLIFIGLNLIGWILYMLYITALIYELFGYILYASMLIIITIGRDKHDVGGVTMGSRMFNFYNNHRARIFIVTTNKEA